MGGFGNNKRWEIRSWNAGERLEDGWIDGWIEGGRETERVSERWKWQGKKGEIINCRLD